MVHALVQFQVDEFAQFWQQFQARDFHWRQAHGSLGAQVFQYSDDPTQVVILFQWESRRQMECFCQQIQTVLPVKGMMAPGNADRALAQAITFLQKAGELEA